MAAEVRPFGVKCNIACQYCYQNPLRDAGNITSHYSLPAMMSSIEAIGGPFTIFGGEPLLMPLKDLSVLWEWGYSKFGENRVQTNGTLISAQHIEMFKQFNVHVGVSIDGPADLNDARWVGNLQRTRETTQRVQENIALLLASGLVPSLIITLHRGNAVETRIPRLLEWLGELDRAGITFVRLHLLEVNEAEVEAKYQLTAEECLGVLSALRTFERAARNIRFDLFREIENLLRAEDAETGCVWNACDPLTTNAVQGIEGFGQLSNCSRTNKAGVDLIKSESEGYERYVALYHSTQKAGGCSGCRFFLICKGQCPGSGEGGDWRNRSAHCEVWKGLFELIEQELVSRGVTPLSLHPNRPEIEKYLLYFWMRGTNPRLSSAVSDWKSTTTVHQQEFAKLTFQRVAWVSREARAVWEPRINSIVRAWVDVELHSLAKGDKNAALVHLTSESLPAVTSVCVDSNLALIPVSLDAQVASGMRGSQTPLKSLSCLITPMAHLEKTKAVWDGGDSHAKLSLLGAPCCCASCASDIYAPSRDAVWEMYKGGLFEAPSDHIAWQLNGFWSRLGLRATGYTPCSSRCTASVARSDAAVALGTHLGYSEEMDWLQDILRWPVEWSALHGIAVVQTPILTIVHDTEFTETALRARFVGETYPTEGASGRKFPYLNKRKAIYSQSPAFKRGLQNPAT